MSDLPYIHLRKGLGERTPPPVWPEGVRPVQFSSVRHAEAIHALLMAAYSRGGGSVAPFDTWWRALRSDSEYDPQMLFVALDDAGEVAGIAHCWSSAFLKDLAVAQGWRKRGLGEALLLHAFRHFRQRGARHLDLKVAKQNPSGALRLYRRLGMHPLH